MTTREIVDELAVKLNVTRAEAERFFDCLIGIWKRALSIGDEVKLDRFGKFVSKLCRKKVRRITGEQVSDTSMEVEFMPYEFLRNELLDLSEISKYLKKEVEYVLETDDYYRGQAQ